MTLRPIARTRLKALAVGLTALVASCSLAGCDPRQALFFLQPFDPKVAPPCPSLKGKRVVVMTSAVAGTQNEYVGIDREITSALVKALRANVKKIDVVDPDKVYDWSRNKPSMTDPADAARAFEADVVIFLEIQKFQVQDPRDLGMYQGRSNIHIQVTELDYPKDDHDRPMKDKPKESKVLFEDDRDTEFPVTGGVPIESGVSKATFKNRFLKVVNEQVSWHFIEHNPGDNIQDTKFGER